MGYRRESITRMNAGKVLAKLLEIERAVFRGDYLVVHALVVEAEECVLQMEREMLEALREHQGQGPGCIADSSFGISR